MKLTGANLHARNAHLLYDRIRQHFQFTFAGFGSFSTATALSAACIFQHSSSATRRRSSQGDCTPMRSYAIAKEP